MEQKENVVIVKKKTQNDTLKNILLYLALILLIVMLFLPPVLRKVVKDKDNTPKTVETFLTCIKEGEVITTSYSDDKPYNLYYSIKGNHTLLNTNENNEIENIEDEKIDEEEIEEEFELIEDIISYSSVTYSETEDKTEFIMPITDVEIDNLDKYKENIEDQNDFYTRYGYSCTKTILK